MLHGLAQLLQSAPDLQGQRTPAYAAKQPVMLHMLHGLYDEGQTVFTAK